MRYDQVCEISRRLALEAGNAIMEVYQAADHGVRFKADQSPVTAADEAADRIICRGLRAAFPGIPLVTEEDAATHAALDAPRFFLIDPLDGTKEFVQRRGDFTVNIALIEGGVPTRGVVYAPARARLFWTDEDGAAVEEHAPFGTGKLGGLTPLRAARGPGPIRIVATKSHRNAATDAYLARYPGAEVVSAGSSLKFCLVAAGEADLYPRLGPTMEWDTAAGHAVLTAAGGRVMQADGTTPLVYAKPGFLNPDFIAVAPDVDLKGA